MQPLVWPHRTFRPRAQEWSVQGASQEGGRPQVGGTPQRILFGGGGLNVAKLNDIHLRTREHFAAWHALAMQLDNGAVPIIVPRCARRSTPLLPTVDISSISHSDGAYFDDDTGYSAGGVGSVVLADAGFRATTLRVRIAGGRPLIGGEPFSFLHPNAGWRIYRVATVVTEQTGSFGADYAITFRTPLRERVSAGDDMEWRLPRCVMRLSDPNGMTLTEDLGRFADASVTFVEDLTVFASDLGF